MNSSKDRSKDRQNAVKKLKAFLLSPKSEIDSFRQKIDDTFSSVYLPNNVECEEKEYGKIKCDVLYPEIYAVNRAVFYIHGGSFVAGSRKSYRPFAASLGNACAAKVILPEFRLAPAFPFPNALEDVQSAFRHLYAQMSVSLSLEQNEDSEKEPEIIIAADSTGASIALAMAFQLDEKIKSSIKKIVLFSPWLNIAEDDEMFSEKKASDEVFTAESVRLCAENYTYQENWKNPLVSPLKASREMISQLPDVFIQCGDKEIFYDDYVVFSDMLKNDGVKCELDVWKNMMPLFQLADDFLKESHLAVEKIGKMFTTQEDEESDEKNI